jgi:hypothetical protein
MTAFDDTLKEFDKQSKKLEGIISSLPLPDKKKARIKHEIGEAMAKYESALFIASRLPATGGTAEYAEEEIKEVRDRYFR